MMGLLTFMSEALHYPVPGRLQALENGLAGLPAGPARQSLAAFVREVGRLSLGEWEELHTRTLDLNPLATPYIGHLTWGDSYKRGSFMAQLNREMLALEVDRQGELPDHLGPVLRYLEAALQPLPELVEILGPAVQKMLASLRKSDPGNAYLRLLEAIEQAVNEKEPRSSRG
jgi:nitrate reductase molybdenum cofactor assembly chaperone NarJ/NarW